MEAVKFDIVERTTTGTGSAREERRQGRVPAVVYGNKGQTPVHISLPRKEFTLFINKQGYKATVVEIEVAGKTVQVITKELQLNPVTDIPEHVDLQILTEGEESRIWIPVKFVGREKSPGIKRGGILNIVRREIEFFCAPGKIPNILIIDLDGREIGDSVHIEQIELPEGTRPVIDRDFTIATIVGKTAKSDAELEEEAEAAALSAEAAAASEAEAGGKAEGGDKAADGKKD